MSECAWSSDVCVSDLIEIKGNQAKVEASINLLDGYEILELARTGIAGLGRGIENVTYIEE